MKTWHELRLPAEEERLWELFHENSKLSPVSPLPIPDTDIDLKLEKMHASLPIQSEYVKACLPAGKALEEQKHDTDSGFQRVFFGRLTTDAPPAGSVSFSDLSRIFFVSSLVTRHDNGAGAYLSPLELYTFVSGIDGLQNGLYHVDLQKQVLQLINEDVSRDQIAQALPGEEGSHVYVFITALLERTMIPFGERGYRIALTESGQVMQNIMLVCAMQSRAARPIINFYDRKLEQILGIDGVNHVLLQVIAI